jgi:hypothetical protein
MGSAICIGRDAVRPSLGKGSEAIQEIRFSASSEKLLSTASRPLTF